jgi:hypothetical protein
MLIEKSAGVLTIAFAFSCNNKVHTYSLCVYIID